MRKNRKKKNKKPCVPLDEHRQEQAGKAHHRADTEGNPIRGGQERTDCGSKRGRNFFLSTALAPVALKSLVVETYDGLQCGSINVITRENYEFLRDSFSHALLLQKEAAHTPGNSIGEGIARLYDEMDALVGDEPECQYRAGKRQALLPFVEVPPVGEV